MQDVSNSELIRRKFMTLVEDLDERGRRRWAAVEAQALGRGGISAVARATGMARDTIRAGLRELADPQPLPSPCQRRPGGGCKPDWQTQPGLRLALDALIEPSARGSPTNPLRWTCLSTRRLAKELRRQGFAASASTVRRLLRQMGYSLQANRKTREGKRHPDRDGQFRHIHRRLLAQKRQQAPSLSVDTKKKEVLGNLKNPGQSYRPKGKPNEVDTHDFPDPKRGKAVPYGVYDIDENQAWVSVGISHDTAEFAVAAIRMWWLRLGRPRYRKAGRLLLTADSGGSNSARSRLWKVELQQLADETGLVIEVCHYPPGTSKWNKIEHRLFCHITRNWAGEPLETAEVVVESIARTTTETGLEVHAWLDESQYEKGRKVSDAELVECKIKRHRFHGEWNYEIHPRL
ncbi:MAG: ISAzo13 family transposase [Gemmataceae bacterium]